MSQQHPRAVRRGNTSGLIGLFNRKAEVENSPCVTADSLRMREDASRRISARDPPKLSLLDTSRHTGASRVASSAAAAARGTTVSVLRKTSEIVRPSFKIEEESEGSGFFASVVLGEKKEEETRKEEEEEDDDFLPLSSVCSRVVYREGRRGSKTTDDIAFGRGDEDKGECSSFAASASPSLRIRSKSVKSPRVKFGVDPVDAEEGTNHLLKSGSQQTRPSNSRGGENQINSTESRRPTSTFSGRLTRQASMPLTTGPLALAAVTPSAATAALAISVVAAAVGSSGSSPLGGGGRVGSAGLVRSATSAKETILAWVQQQVNHYKNVSVTNFSMSWSDGLAFCALIHNFYPEAFDFDKLDARNRRYNFTLAFKAAEEFGDICPLLEVDDMVKMTKPDWKCVFTYVQGFYRRFRQGRDPPSPTKTLFLGNSNRGILNMQL